jgi:hypothetical protein
VLQGRLPKGEQFSVQRHPNPLRDCTYWQTSCFSLFLLFFFFFFVVLGFGCLHQEPPGRRQKPETADGPFARDRGNTYCISRS